jgi:hypothetical protein
VAERLLAVQGQDPKGFRLAVRSRTRGLAASDVDRALTEDRSLIVTWVNRGTLHLIRAEDYALLQLLTTPPLVTGNLRRLEQEGVSPDQADRGVRAVVDAIAADGPRTRAQLSDRIAAAGVRVEGQALVHVLFRAALLGHTVRGPMVGGEQAHVLVADWLGAGATTPPDRDVALAELGRRYLAGHGPARDRDLARWAGIGVREARVGLAAISGELSEGEDGLVDLRRRPAPEPPPPPRLLGPFDPLLLGWADRTPVVGDQVGLVTDNGLFRPFALVEGRAAGLWRIPGGKVELEPFGPLPKAVREALADDARDVERFLAG